MNNLLYIAQQDSITPAIASLITSRNITTWGYFGEDTTWRIWAESILPENLHQISISRKLDNAAAHLHRPYIGWVGNLVGFRNRGQ